MIRRRKTRVVIFGPSRTAVSGVSTHLNMLLGSTLANDFELLHFRVGSEDRNERCFKNVWRLATSPFFLAIYLLWRRPQIVHVNTSLNGKAYWRDLIYLAVSRLLFRKVVYQIHGGASPQTFFPGNRVLTRMLRSVLRMSAAVVVLSQEELTAYRSFDDRIKVHLIPNAINTDDALEARRSMNLDAPLRLVYVGRLAVNKGLFDIVEALRLLRARGHDFSLHVAGCGSAECALKTAVQKAGVERHVIFLGAVFGAAKNLLWLNSDIFVFPTWGKERLPYALLEAMAAACVPVTCRVAAIPDVVEDEVHGLFVPAKDPERLACALAQLDRDRNAIARMGSACRARIRAKFTITRLAEDFRRLYLSL